MSQIIYKLLSGSNMSYIHKISNKLLINHTVRSIVKQENVWKASTAFYSTLSGQKFLSVTPTIDNKVYIF